MIVEAALIKRLTFILDKFMFNNAFYRNNRNRNIIIVIVSLITSELDSLRSFYKSKTVQINGVFVNFNL